MKTFAFGFAIIYLSASTIAVAQEAPFSPPASEEKADTAAHSGQDKEAFAGDLSQELRGTLTTAPAASRPSNPALSESPTTATEPEAAGAARPSPTLPTLSATTTEPEATGAARPSPALPESSAAATEPEAAGVAPSNPALSGLSDPNTATAGSPAPKSKRVIKSRTAKRPTSMADQWKAFMRRAFGPLTAKASISPAKSRSASRPVASIPPRRASAPSLPKTGPVRPQG